jgi:dTDP-4-amino-4,6-dideoxygalactose transaminase
MTQPNERLYSNARAYEFDVPEQGFRYHLANLHAAIGTTQIRALPTFITNRQKYGRAYNESFRDVPGLIVPNSDFTDVSVFHYVVRVTGGGRDEFRQHLRAGGVDTGVHWLPGHWFSKFRTCRGANALPVTDRVGSEIVTLPLWSFMDEDTLATVVDAVRSFKRGSSTVRQGDAARA